MQECSGHAVELQQELPSPTEPNCSSLVSAGSSAKEQLHVTYMNCLLCAHCCFLGDGVWGLVLGWMEEGSRITNCMNNQPLVEGLFLPSMSSAKGKKRS